MSDRSRISAQVEDALLGEIRARAQRDAVYVSDVIRSALVAYLGYRLPVDERSQKPVRPDVDQCPTPAEFFLGAGLESLCPLCGEKRFPGHLTQAKLNKLKGSA